MESMLLLLLPSCSVLGLGKEEEGSVFLFFWGWKEEEWLQYGGEV